MMAGPIRSYFNLYNKNLLSHDNIINSKRGCFVELPQVGHVDVVGEPGVTGGVEGEAVPQPVELEGEVYGTADDARTEHSLQYIRLHNHCNHEQ